MAKDQTKPLAPVAIKADRDALAAIKGMTGYASAKPEYELTKLDDGETALADAEDDYTQKEGAFKASRDALVAAQWAFHNVIIGGKQQVVGKFGDDSDQAQAVGLKKKSERAKPKRKSSGGNPPPKPA